MNAKSTEIEQLNQGSTAKYAEFQGKIDSLISENEKNQQIIQQLQQQEQVLNQKQEENISQMNALNDQIVAKDEEISKLKQDTGAKAVELQKTVDTLTQQTQDNQITIQQLKQQLESLKLENDDLVQRIIAATQAIMEATSKLETLNDPSSFDEAGLEQAFAEVEKSIQEISNAIQGNSKALPSVRDVLNPQQKLETLLEQLKVKQQSDPTNANVNNAIAQLEELKLKPNFDSKEITTIFQNNNIEFRNNQITKTGGKTKKNRRYKKTQKGGFTYKKNAKRKSFSTLLYRNKTSSRNSSSGRKTRRSAR
jgi:chromosome segregation ATPase